MKHKTRRTAVTLLCVLALVLGCCVTGAAADPAADFQYTVGADGVTLTGYTGSSSILRIPAELGGKPVVAIGDGCFAGLLCLQRVYVPEGITRVGDYAFEACSALQRIYLPTSLTEIGDGAFSGCGHLTLVDLQDSVERIGKGAFLCCDALVSVELPAALREMGDFAFGGCSSLARVTFGGEQIAAIPDRAFYGCEDLTRIVIPESVTEIGKRAFSGCKSLRNFYISQTLTSLGEYAFENCEQLASVTVPAPVIRTGTFRGCMALRYLSFDTGVQRIEPFAFRNCGASDVSLGADVTDIAPGAFYGAEITGLTVAEENPAYRVTDGALLTADGRTMLFWMPDDPYAEEPQTAYAVPDGVEVIAEYAFAFCPLTSVQLPESLKEIRAYAFANTDVQDMPIPEGVTVDPNAFSDPDAPEDPDAAPLAAPEAVSGSAVTTESAAGDKSLYHEEDYAEYREIANEDFDAWCEEYLAYNEAQGNPIREDLIPYIMRYKGEVIPHFMAMTAVQNHDPEMWANAVNFFGDDFEQMYLMMNHGLFTELRRGRMQDDLVLYSGVYDSQLMAAAGTDTVPTQEQLIDAIGNTFTDPVMISTTTDPAVACGFGETLFIIYASREALEAHGAVCMDAVVRSAEKETLLPAYASYRVLDVGEMTVTHQDPWDETPVTEQRHYVRVELLGPEKPANPFEDVSEGQYFYDAVLWAVENGVTNGVDATHFAPALSATRAQMVTFLWRAAGMPEPKDTQNPFVDVPDGAYYAKAVLWAAETGITNGTDATHFAPNRSCTRGEFVTFLYRFRGCQKAAAAENPFVDVTSGKYYYDAVLWAADAGITNGTDATHFSPAKACTRGETVTLLYRALGA